MKVKHKITAIETRWKSYGEKIGRILVERIVSNSNGNPTVTVPGIPGIHTAVFTTSSVEWLMDATRVLGWNPKPITVMSRGIDQVCLD